MIKNCLGIIPVLVKGRIGNSCKTFALLDDGADKTLCDERLLQKLNIASKPVTFEMSTVSSSGSTIHGQEVDLQVKAIDGNDNVSLKKVWSVKKLPISARSAAENVDIRKLSYLADIQIPSTDLTEVMLLIGTDSPNAHIPLEVRSGNENQPYAVRSRLGWAIRGPIEDTHATNVINVHFEEAREVLLQRQLERMWTSDFDDRAREDKNGLSIEDTEAMKMMESVLYHPARRMPSPTRRTSKSRSRSASASPGKTEKRARSKTPRRGKKRARSPSKKARKEETKGGPGERKPQQRSKWQREERDVEIDDIVLVADERIQRGQWPLGRIVEVTRSRDGHIRSCVVKTSQSHILRPINKLCLLECSK
ncbi:Hypothetical predicted protein [Mytilus galloprovincialis]|uniref:DUF5641 domain-containing protein n=1 Tax=Mytilus galloprovincialis TaxID=29158 RepID=A0A8B6CWU1_MYTGA|nr:Hypothetical predicted protein [Mytilus galloprovincialis]